MGKMLFKINDGLEQQLRECARNSHKTMTACVEEALEGYVRQHGPCAAMVSGGCVSGMLLYQVIRMG